MVPSTKPTMGSLSRALAYWQGAQARLDEKPWNACPYPETKTCNLGSLIGQWRYGYNFARVTIEQARSEGRSDVKALCQKHISDLENHRRDLRWFQAQRR